MFDPQKLQTATRGKPLSREHIFFLFWRSALSESALLLIFGCVWAFYIAHVNSALNLRRIALGIN